MLFYEVEEMLKTMQLPQIPLRVAIYARVSTESEQQATSIVNQNEYYTEMVQSIPKWTLVGIYTDEGITGMSVKKREEFNRMIADAKLGKFDLVLTKTVSRFARNTLDAIKYARELKKNNVGVWFHQDGVLTFDKDSEFKLTLMAAMAQNESEKKSVAVKFGIHQAIKRGTVFGFDNMYGLRKKDGRYYIDEKEMEMVRMVFDLFRTDKYSLHKLEKVLWDKGYRNRNGKMISHVTLSHIIRNPKYKGLYVGNKVMQTDIFEKKFIILPESEWYMFKAPDIVPQGVPDDVWDECNRILDRRSDDVKNRKGICNSPNLMTGKIRCVHCDRTYHRKDSGYNRKRVVSTWICAGKIQNGAKSCPAKYIYEDELKHILYNLLVRTSGELDEYIRKYEKLFAELAEDNDAKRKREALEAENEKLTRRKSKLLAYNADGEISDKEFLAFKREIDEEIHANEIEIMKLGGELLSEKSIDQRLKEIREAMRKLEEIECEEDIDEVFVRNYIDVIDAEVIDGVPHLRIKLVTGKVFEEELVSLRSGNRSNLLLPGRSFTFDRLDIMGRAIHKLVCYAEVQVI